MVSEFAASYFRRLLKTIFRSIFRQDVAQSVDVKELDEHGFFPKDDRIIGEAFTPEEGKDALGITIPRRPRGDDDTFDERPPGMVTQVRLLFKRELQNLRRDVTAVAARFGLTTFLGILIGIIFFDVGASDSSVFSNVQSHFGALIMVLLMSMFGTAQPALLAFPEERPVFLREYSTSHYSAAAYFLSRLTMEALITAAQVFWMASLSYLTSGHRGSSLWETFSRSCFYASLSPFCS